MARYTFMREGRDWAINGNWFLPEALKWHPDGKYPILSPAQNQMLGHASDIRREDDGSITAEFHFNQDLHEEALLDISDSWGWTLYAKEVVSQGRTIESATLVYIFFGYGVPWGGSSQEKQGS